MRPSIRLENAVLVVAFTCVPLILRGPRLLCMSFLDNVALSKLLIPMSLWVTTGFLRWLPPRYSVDSNNRRSFLGKPFESVTAFSCDQADVDEDPILCLTVSVCGLHLRLPAFRRILRFCMVSSSRVLDVFRRKPSLNFGLEQHDFSPQSP